MTIAELVTRALQLAGVVGMNRAPSAEEMNDGIATLNEMMFAWALEGMDLGWQTAVQTDNVLVDDAYLKAMRYCLAVELAQAHGITDLPPLTVQIAIAEQGNVRNSVFEIDNLRLDNAIIRRATDTDPTCG